jgi:hypothetical protein
MGIPNLGPKFVAGSASNGRLLFYRDDGTSDYLPGFIMFMGTVTDVTGDGIINIDFPGGS